MKPRKTKPIDVKATIRLHVYRLVADAIDQGVIAGLRKATAERPLSQATNEAASLVAHEVLCSLGEVIDWGTL